jgi:3-hydroxybutyryl-CoA dehydratase
VTVITYDADRDDMNLEEGARVERRHTVSDAAVRRFAEATGDRNPIHLDAEYAARTRFGDRIAHGMLVASYISAALAEDLPGPGTVYLGQTLRFVRPVRIGDEVTVRLEIIEIIRQRSRARISTVCVNQSDEVVIDGEATVLLPSTEGG